LVVAKLPGGAWFLNRNRVKNFTLFSLIFLYCSSSMEIRERKKEIMPLDVFSLVMAFLTSATSLAAALVQLQTAKIAAQGTKKRPNRRQRRRGHQKAPQPPSAPPRAPKSAPTAVSAAEGARAHNCPSRRQKNAYRRSRREKSGFFRVYRAKNLQIFRAMRGRMSAHGNPQNPPISPVFAKTPGRCRFSPPPPTAPEAEESSPPPPTAPEALLSA
jgi:hypothetical protein